MSLSPALSFIVLQSPHVSLSLRVLYRLQVPSKVFLRAWMAEVAGRLEAQAPPQFLASPLPSSQPSPTVDEAGQSRRSAASSSSDSGETGLWPSGTPVSAGHSSQAVQTPGKGFGRSTPPLPPAASRAPVEPAAREAAAAAAAAGLQAEPSPHGPTEGGRRSGSRWEQHSSGPLSGSVLSCCGWALAKLQLRPKQSWCVSAHICSRMNVCICKKCLNRLDGLCAWVFKLLA